jgi:uncharacterized protein
LNEKRENAHGRNAGHSHLSQAFEMPEFDALKVASLLIVAFIAGLARGFSGFGAALIFMPLAAKIIGPQLAAPVLLLTDFVMALPMLPSAFPLISRVEVLLLAAGALLSVPFGTYLLSALDPLALRWVIERLVMIMLVLLMSGWRYHGKPHWLASLGIGACSGLGSGIAQIGGPPVVAYLISSERGAARMRATVVVFFAILSLFAGATYAYSGLLTENAASYGLTSAPAYGMGLWLGAKCFGIASEEVFQRVCLFLIALAVITGLPMWDRVV